MSSRIRALCGAVTAARPVSSPVPADLGRLNRATGVFSFTAGQTRQFEGRAVAVGAGLADIAVRVFAPADEELKHFRVRASLSNKAAVALGPGGTETITFTPAVSGRYGVVVINKSGSGSYTLQRT
jgi:hypothetical protein